MDKLFTVQINGKTLYLNYSIAVMFDVTDRYGNIQELLTIISKDGKEAFEALRWLAVLMANDGELCRRYLGYEHGAMITEDDLPSQISPYDYAKLKEAVVQAIVYGHTREVSDDSEQDLGLAELNQKKTKIKA